jgi:hypothetical protein
VDFQGDKIILQRADKYKSQKSPVPPSVENVTADNNERVLQFEIFCRAKPVQKEHNRQKYGKFKGIEEHLEITPPPPYPYLMGNGCKIRRRLGRNGCVYGVQG